MSYAKVTSKSPYAPIRYEAKFSFMLPEYYKWRKSLTAEQKMSHTHLNDWLLEKMPSWDLIYEDAVAALDTFSMGQFYEAGKNIYDMPEILLETLNMTDIGNIPISALELPHNFLYLHWGKFSKDFQGVFIGHERIDSRSNAYTFDFVTHEFGTGQLDKSDWQPESTASIHLVYQHGDETLQALFEKDKSSSESVMNFLGTQFGHNQEQQNEILQSTLNEKALCQKHMALAVNSLFYLLSAKDLETDWGSDVPQDKLAKLQKEKSPGGKKSLEDGLQAAGYRKVHYMGRVYAKSAEARALKNHIATGRTVASHWRRGHYKQQAHGKNMALRKLIFIAPTLINPDGEQAGKIHVL